MITKVSVAIIDRIRWEQEIEMLVWLSEDVLRSH